MAAITIRGVEHVYDAFDEYEHPNPIHLRVTDMTPIEAMLRGRQLLQDMVDKERREGGYLSNGTFIAELTQIEDENGLIYFQNSDPIQTAVRHFGGDVEDYRDTIARHVFLSYSHRDWRFVRKFMAQIKRRGLRLWYDKSEINGMICRPLKFDGQRRSSDEELLAELKAAIERTNYLLLVLSHNSIASHWVEAEVRIALGGEKRYETPIALILIEADVLEKAPKWVSEFAERFQQYDFFSSGVYADGSSLSRLLLDVFQYRGLP